MRALAYVLAGSLLSLPPAHAEEATVAQLVSTFANGQQIKATTTSGAEFVIILVPGGMAVLTAPDKAWTGVWRAGSTGLCIKWENRPERCFTAEIAGRVATIFENGEPLGTWTR